MNTKAYIKSDTCDTTLVTNVDREIYTYAPCAEVPMLPSLVSQVTLDESGKPGFAMSDLDDLTKCLIQWAEKNHPAAVDSIADNLDNPKHCWKCLGAIFRRAVKLDPPWLWKVIDAAPADVRRLSPHIGEITWASLGYPDEWGAIPGSMGWVEWIKAAEVAGLLAYGDWTVLQSPPPIRESEVAEICAIASRDEPGLFGGAP